MPLLNTTGILKRQRGIAIGPIISDQWIAQLNTTTYGLGGVVVDSLGNAYVNTGFANQSQGITKITSTGSLVFSKISSDGDNGITAIDSSDNVYVGYQLYVAGVSYPNIIKYDSNGNILWQKYFPSVNNRQTLAIQPTNAGDLFVLTGNAFGGDPLFGGAGPYVVWKLDPTNGSTISQRTVLNFATGTNDIYVDSTNGQLIIAGTDYGASPNRILIGFYNFTNTDAASNVLYQEPSNLTTDSYDTFFAGQSFQNVVADSSFVYQVAYRTISGITRSIYQKINRTTGAVSYSYDVTTSGNSLALIGITIDNSGSLYITGNSAGSFQSAYIMKINASTGAITWIKRVGDLGLTIFETLGGPTWSNGYVYFNVTAGLSPSPNQHALFKLKDDGSATSGTYGGIWNIGSVTATNTSYLPFATGTTTDQRANYTQTTSNSAITVSTSTVSLSTYSV